MNKTLSQNEPDINAWTAAYNEPIDTTKQKNNNEPDITAWTRPLDAPKQQIPRDPESLPGTPDPAITKIRTITRSSLWDTFRGFIGRILGRKKRKETPTAPPLSN